jgi:AmmeMemoRadiSam system protein B
VGSARPPAVAGSFYPADARELAELVGGLLAEARPPALPAAPKVLIAPHAGYVYSGPVAATAFACWAGHRAAVRTVVLLGPAHYAHLEGMALPAHDAYATPLGEVPLDRAACGRLRSLPAVSRSEHAHAREHSLEVELPFLQAVLGEFALVPLLVGRAAPDDVAEALEALWGGDETRIVVSTDLSHYLPYDDARAADDSAARAIDTLTRLDPESACGAHAVNGLLALARRMRLEPRLLDLRNSGDTAGDKRSVVGYSAFAFLEPAEQAA